MCRVLGYLGPPVLLADLLTRPANSLVNQSFDAEHHDLLQLGGTGLASWDRTGPDAQEPLLYKSCQPAFYDRNLASVCSKLRTTNLLAHIRATGYSQSAAINDENCHPFIYPKMRLALAHNGGLPGWRDMLRAIVGASKPDIVRQLSGSTDTEPLYALLMSQYDDPTADMKPAEIIDGLRKFMQRILEIKRDHDNVKQAKLKFFLADGNDLVVANIGLGFDFAKEIDAPWEELLKAKKGTPEYALSGVVEPVWYLAGKDYGLHDDQYTFGTVSNGAGSNGAGSNDMDAVVISSEPLTRDPSDWTAVPFQHVVFFRRTDSGCDVTVEKLEF
jgi:glutamine amidotransferase